MLQGSVRDKPMFQTVFSPSREEALKLLDFGRFLWLEDVADKVAAHPHFAPSAVWRKWAGQTFMGFSLEKILLQGGHAFPSSIEVGAEDGPTGRLANLRRCLGGLLTGSGRHRMRAGRDPKHLSAAFKQFYPDAVVCPEHEAWFARHPNPYFRCLEAYLLREKAPLPARMLEVGAGACVNVAFYHSLNRRMKSIIVDLPETMFFGYTVLRAVLPDLQILLPHEVGGSAAPFEADVVFLLPTQTGAVPDESVDFCFNMSSFQEMSIATVNRYLEFMARKLRIGGRLVSVNFEVSRYLDGNALKNYDLAGYHSTASTRPAPFGTNLMAHVPGLRVMHLEIEKRRPA
jgi:hypothetical protein